MALMHEKWKRQHDAETRIYEVFMIQVVHDINEILARGKELE